MDAITVLRSANGEPINKIARRRPDGAVMKPTRVTNSGRFIARTVQVPDVEAFAAVLREVGERPDACISLSVFKDSPSDEFGVVPKTALARHLEIPEHDRDALAGFHEIDGALVAARIKQSMEVGSWMLLDRDFPPEMPDALAALTLDQWVEAVDLLIPGFAVAGRVMVPSASGRIIGSGVPPANPSCHVFVQLDSTKDLKSGWDMACHRALCTEHRGEPLWFTKPSRSRATGEILGRGWGTIFDKGTIAPARLVFDGAPVVQGDDLAVEPAVITVTAGKRIARAKLGALSPRKEKGLIEDALEQIHGVRPTIEIAKSTAGRITGIKTITIHDLTEELVLETLHGPRSVGELRKSGAGHTRCQSPYRDSISWAAFYGVHGDGSPFVFDSGTCEKHMLTRAGQLDLWEIIFDWMGEKYPSDAPWAEPHDVLGGREPMGHG